MKKAINIVSISDEKILLFRKKGVWILPGGKPEENESDQDCLIRECSEEIPRAQLEIGDFFGSFVGETPHTHVELCAVVYLGSITGDISPGAEIEKTSFFTKEQCEELSTSEITKKIISDLVLKNLL
jgi:8-oxo-dGTP diphosphatase